MRPARTSSLSRSAGRILGKLADAIRGRIVIRVSCPRSLSAVTGREGKVKFYILFLSKFRLAGKTFIRWVALVGQRSACNVGDAGLIPGLGRCPEEGHRNPIQYSCLGNPTDKGDWHATVRSVAEELDTTKQQGT